MKKLPCKEFGDTYIRKEAYIIVPILSIFITLACFSNLASFIKTLLIIVLILIAVTGTVWQSRRLKQFACPACGKKILSPTIHCRRDGDPVNYYCPDCDIEWETGLTETTTV